MGERVGPGLVLAPRSARPRARFHLYGALAATALSVLAAVAAVSARELPPVEFSVVLFATAPLAASVALAVLWTRSRDDRDLPLQWVSVGLALSVLGMALQLVSFPTVSSQGGPLRTSGDASAALYLWFHLSLALGALAGALRLHTRWRLPTLVAGASLLVLVAADVLPSPDLLTPDQAFTGLLARMEYGLAAFLLLSLLVWALTEGAVSTPMRGWVGVALALAASDVVLNSLVERRFDALWWSSLTLRATTFVVLAAGVLAALLSEARRFEAYSESELTRRETELASSLQVTERLLDNARALAAAITPTQVVDALTAAASAVAALPRVLVFAVHASTGELSLLGLRGYDAASAAAVTVRPLRDLPANTVAETGRPVFLSTRAEVLGRYPSLASVPVHETRTACLAAVPLVVAGRVVGVLKVTGDRPQRWSAVDRELLAGLAAQGGQALVRAWQHEHEHTAAQVLQRALLPRVLTERDDVQLAARYLPGAQGVDVGGDWYDSIPCGSRLALVVGDVVGKGLDAATVMGQLRTSVRVLTTLDPSPAAVLTGLDHAVARLSAENLFATLLYLLVDPDSGQATMARAGHMPPLVALPGRPPELVTAGGSLPLGTPPGGRPQASLSLPPGSTVVLFSDGLVECHPDGLRAGLDHLQHAVAQYLLAHEPDAEQLAAAVLEATPPERPDDIALLVMVLGPSLARGAEPGATGVQVATRG
jgi:hypothetical protein